MSVALSSRERLVRFAFRRCMKDKHLRALARRHWPPMDVAIEGHRFELHPADNTTERRLFCERRLDERESLAALLARVTGRCALIVDVGANCGAYTVPLAAAAAPGSRVLAFEPSPVMASRLARNLALNGLEALAAVHRVALAAERGTAVLHVHPRNHGQSSLRPLDAVLERVEVERRPLADYLPRTLEGFETAVVKIDVEGREDDVLCPFLEGADDDALPAAILVETVLASSWERDLPTALAARGYAAGLEAEGNTLFTR